jgi:hypothetical protein
MLNALGSWALNGSDVSDDGVGIVVVETEQGHVLVSAEQTVLDPAHQRAQFDSVIERSEAGSGRKRAGTAPANGVTLAA